VPGSLGYNCRMLTYTHDFFATDGVFFAYAKDTTVVNAKRHTRAQFIERLHATRSQADV